MSFGNFEPLLFRLLGGVILFLFSSLVLSFSLAAHLIYFFGHFANLYPKLFYVHLQSCSKAHALFSIPFFFDTCLQPSALTFHMFLLPLFTEFVGRPALLLLATSPPRVPMLPLLIWKLFSSCVPSSSFCMPWSSPPPS